MLTILKWVLLVFFLHSDFVEAFGMKRGNFLKVFTVINFPNQPCNTTVTNRTGVCYTLPECRSRKGIPLGSCAGGFGVCCLFEISCEETSSNNGTYFTSPDYPSFYDQERTCAITIRKLNSNICQIRLDFNVFQLRPPFEGSCSLDRLVVSGQSQNSIIPPICGTNNRQHCVSDTEGSIMINVITLGSHQRKFDIKISQISCRDVDRVPSNCLQYYTGVQGNIKSFNYNFNPRFDQIQGNQPFETVENGYFNNLDYAICFRKELGFCSITFTVANSTISTTGNNLPSPSFAIRQGDGSSPVQGMAQAGPTECQSDYLILANIRFCGGRLNPDLTGSPNFNADVVDVTSGPFIARFVTDRRYNERGFDLNYRQNPCTVAG
ncbi:uncharacterized protein [Centruroides vittatus]|uniref:uncharacterized protein n=1 Tax=Centruroides vittatus TaxID=120091 RepID=UPI0035104A3B